MVSRKALMLAMCALATAGCDSSHSSPGEVRGSAIGSKVDFEQSTGAIVWDIGSRRGDLDGTDDVTDPERECDITDANAPNVSPRLAARRHDRRQLKAQVESLQAGAGFNDRDLKMNAVRALVGRADQPLVLLFPELHITSDSAHPVYELHQNHALDMWNIAEQLVGKVKMLNTAEGPQGEWARQTRATPRTGDDRRQVAAQFMSHQWVSGAVLLGELFSEVMDSKFHDQNEDALKYVLTLRASVHRETFEQARAGLLTTLPTRSARVNLDSLRPFQHSLVGLDQDSIVRMNTQICEARSHEMARYTIELARRQGAKVIFMSFGALHLHGILAELEFRGVNAIAYSPNY